MTERSLMPFIGTLDTTFMADAACKGMGANLFHPDAGGDVRTPGSDAYEARRICLACPVIEQCLDYALHLPASQCLGIIAATTFTQRARLRRQWRAEGKLPPATTHPPRPIQHGAGTAEWRRCRIANSEACDACRAGHAAENLRRKAS